MRSRWPILVLLLLACAGAARARPPDRDWQTSKLLSVEEGPVTHVAGPGFYSECQEWLYTVETETLTYVFSAHTGTWCVGHPHPFTVGAQVKFALAGKGKAYLVDEDGTEFKARLVKKTQRTTR
jgi:hypothetical protein